MAQQTRQTLQQIVKDADGNVEQAPDKGQAQTQAAAQGLGATPSTPMGAAGTGVTPDSAKMAGTPAAMAGQQGIAPATGQGMSTFSATEAPVNVAPTAPPAAQQVPQPQGRRLGDILQQQELAPQVDPAQVAKEQKRREESAQLQQRFGAIGSRVADMIHGASDQIFGATPAAGSPAAPATMTLTPEASKLEPGLSGDILSASQVGLTNTSIRDLATRIGAATGQDPASVDLSKYVAGLDPGTTVAKATQDALLVNDGTAKELGFQDVADIATQLGVPAASLQGKSLGELTSIARSKLATDFGDVDAAKAAVMDPLLGPNERRAARQTLAAAGLDGTLMTDQHVKALDRELANADTITFNGEQMSVEDMLSDQHMTSLATQWADAGPGSEFRAALMKSEPSLAAWLNKHEAFVQDAATKLGSSLDQFKTLQAANQKAVTDTAASTGLSSDQVDSVLSALGMAHGFSGEEVKVPDLLSQLATQGKAAGIDPATAGQQIAKLATNPAALKAAETVLQGQGWAGLAKMGFGSKDPAKQAAAESNLQWKGSIPQGKELEDPAKVAAFILGVDPTSDSGYQTPQDALAGETRMLRDLRSAANAALPLNAQQRSLLAVLDADGDGKVDDPKKVAGRLASAVAGGSLAQGGSGGGVSWNVLGPLSTTFKASGTLKPADVKAKLADLVAMPQDSYDKLVGQLKSARLDGSLKSALADVQKGRDQAAADVKAKAAADAAEEKRLREIGLETQRKDAREAATKKGGSQTHGGSSKEGQHVGANATQAYADYVTGGAAENQSVKSKINKAWGI